MELPALRVVKLMVQGFPVKLFGTDHAAGIRLQKADDLPSLGVLRHEVFLHSHKLLLYFFAEFHGTLAAPVDGHGFRPYLQQICPGSVLVLQNVDFRFLRVDHDRQEAPVARPVKGQEVQRVGSASEHALAQPVFGLCLVWRPVGFLLPADKGADFLNALSAVGCQHLRHFQYPVALQLREHLIVIQPLQIVAEPFVLDCQQPEKGRFTGSLSSHQAEHFLIFAAGGEYPPDRPKQEMPEYFLNIIAALCS